jgi:hypothetical protein
VQFVRQVCRGAQGGGLAAERVRLGDGNKARDLAGSVLARGEGNGAVENIGDAQAVYAG